MFLKPQKCSTRTSLFLWSFFTLLRAGDVVDEFLFEVGDLLGGDGVEVTTDTTVDDANLDGNIHGLVLVLLEELSKTLT